LPLPILYVFADIICFVAYRIAGYRKKVVFRNLKKSFPEKAEKEIKKLARKYYKHMADLIVETIHGLTISEKELIKRVNVKNYQLLNDYHDKGLSIVMMTSHQNNWEWLTHCLTYLSKAEVNGAYAKLKSPFSENLMMKTRTRFGGRFIEKKVIIRDLIKRKDVIKIVGMVSDQSPVFDDKRYWTTFLNQETAFFTGSEKIARKFGMPVLYAKVDKVRRGYYEIEYIVIDEPPFNPEPDSITKGFVELVEDHIKESPSTWLWSHKRWKMKRK